MAFNNEQHRQRYAQDEEHRKRKLADNLAWRTEHRDALNAAWSEKWRTDPAFPERKVSARRLKKYGLDAQTYERMLAEQGGVCAYCRRKPTRWLCVDHCHATGVVRSLLCDRCNMGVGHLGDDPERMRHAADRIEQSRGIREANRIVARIPTAAFKLTFGDVKGSQLHADRRNQAFRNLAVAPSRSAVSKPSSKNR
jgi:Autographiviridae endonuclease VII